MPQIIHIREDQHLIEGHGGLYRVIEGYRGLQRVIEGYRGLWGGRIAIHSDLALRVHLLVHLPRPPVGTQPSSLDDVALMTWPCACLQALDIVPQTHHVFWMGDLNYRLDPYRFGLLPAPKVTRLTRQADGAQPNPQDIALARIRPDACMRACLLPHLLPTGTPGWESPQVRNAGTSGCLG